MKRTMKLMNMTKFKDKDIEEIALVLLEGQLAPSFLLICVHDGFHGVSITNLDRPTILIRITDLGQFAETFVHELTHLQQHCNNYADENEAYKKMREYVVTL